MIPFNVIKTLDILSFIACYSFMIFFSWKCKVIEKINLSNFGSYEAIHKHDFCSAGRNSGFSNEGFTQAYSMMTTSAASTDFFKN